MKKYDASSVIFNSKKLNRGTDYVSGYYYGAWRIDYWLDAPGLVVYTCTWCDSRAKVAEVVATGVLIILITIAVVASDGAATPAYVVVLA